MNDSNPAAIKINWNDHKNCFESDHGHSTSLPKNLTNVRDQILAESGLRRKGDWLAAIVAVWLLVCYSVGAYFLHQSKHELIARWVLGVGPFISFASFMYLSQDSNRLDKILHYLKCNKYTFEQYLLADGYKMDAFFVKGRLS
jgi:hypothetical protein